MNLKASGPTVQSTHASNGLKKMSMTLEEQTSGHMSSNAHPHLCITQPGKKHISILNPNYLNPKLRPRLSDLRTQLGKRRIIRSIISWSICMGY